MSLDQGVILSRTGTTVTVELDGETLPAIQLARHLHATGQANPGDACLIGISHGARFVVGVLGTAPAPPPPPPTTDLTPGDISVDDKKQLVTTSGTDPVSPVWTGTYRGGWRKDTTDLYQGDYTGRGINIGAAYYGNGLRQWDKLNRLRVALRRGQGGVFAAQTPTMALLAGTTRPSGAPVILATAPGPALTVGQATVATPKAGQVGHWQPPTDWLQRLGPGGDAGGIGITTQGSRNPYLSLVTSGGGMTITTEWENTE